MYQLPHRHREVSVPLHLGCWYLSLHSILCYARTRITPLPCIMEHELSGLYYRFQFSAAYESAWLFVYLNILRFSLFATKQDLHLSMSIYSFARPQAAVLQFGRSWSKCALHSLQVGQRSSSVLSMNGTFPKSALSFSLFLWVFSFPLCYSTSLCFLPSLTVVPCSHFLCLPFSSIVHFLQVHPAFLQTLTLSEANGAFLYSPLRSHLLQSPLHPSSLSCLVPFFYFSPSLLQAADFLKPALASQALRLPLSFSHCFPSLLVLS